MKILLADDQQDVRLGLRIILEQQPGLKIVAEADAYKGLLMELEKAEPDIILLDWELPGLNILYTVSDLRLKRPNLKVIALSGNPEIRKAALNKGADAFVCKCDQPEKIVEAIESVIKEGGKNYAIDRC